MNNDKNGMRAQGWKLADFKNIKSVKIPSADDNTDLFNQLRQVLTEAIQILHGTSADDQYRIVVDLILSRFRSILETDLSTNTDDVLKAVISAINAYVDSAQKQKAIPSSDKSISDSSESSLADFAGITEQILTDTLLNKTSETHSINRLDRQFEPEVSLNSAGYEKSDSKQNVYPEVSYPPLKNAIDSRYSDIESSLSRSLNSLRRIETLTQSSIGILKTAEQDGIVHAATACDKLIIYKQKTIQQIQSFITDQDKILLPTAHQVINTIRKNQNNQNLKTPGQTPQRTVIDTLQSSVNNFMPAHIKKFEHAMAKSEQQNQRLAGSANKTLDYLAKKTRKKSMIERILDFCIRHLLFNKHAKRGFIAWVKVKFPVVGYVLDQVDRKFTIIRKGLRAVWKLFKKLMRVVRKLISRMNPIKLAIKLFKFALRKIITAIRFLLRNFWRAVRFICGQLWRLMCAVGRFLRSLGQKLWRKIKSLIPKRLKDLYKRIISKIQSIFQRLKQAFKKFKRFLRSIYLRFKRMIIRIKNFFKQLLLKIKNAIKSVITKIKTVMKNMIKKIVTTVKSLIRKITVKVVTFFKRMVIKIFKRIGINLIKKQAAKTAGKIGMKVLFKFVGKMIGKFLAKAALKLAGTAWVNFFGPIGWIIEALLLIWTIVDIITMVWDIYKMFKEYPQLWEMTKAKVVEYVEKMLGFFSELWEAAKKLFKALFIDAPKKIGHMIGDLLFTSNKKANAARQQCEDILVMNQASSLATYKRVTENMPLKDCLNYKIDKYNALEQHLPHAQANIMEINSAINKEDDKWWRDTDLILSLIRRRHPLYLELLKFTGEAGIGLSKFYDLNVFDEIRSELESNRTRLQNRLQEVLDKEREQLLGRRINFIELAKLMKELQDQLDSDNKKAEKLTETVKDTSNLKLVILHDINEKYTEIVNRSA